MYKRVKSKAVSVKNHVIRHRGKYSAGTTALVFLWLMIYRANEWTEFLVEKGIDPDEFFNPEFYAELHP